MSSETRSRQLRSWALEEGFDAAAIARLGPSSHGDFFEEWLAAGHQAGMHYLERRVELRLDPCQILPGACSALCVALRYHPIEGDPTTDGDLWPGVARYARGEDYHQVMEARLTRLAQRIVNAYPSTQSKLYVDTGPILERDLAARAGLGSVGKNTNLLDPTMGSWFLLGEILLTLELEPDIPGSDLCGTCAECLEACPTGALPEAYRLDSRLCISYWTIEHRGSVPRELRPMLGSWVFGCDICQEVCPVNAELVDVDHPELKLPEARRELDLVALLSMDHEQYVERFRGSPMKRAKLSGLQRNAAIVMGNSGKVHYVRPLLETLETGEAVVRLHAAWALGRLGTPEALAGLEAALVTEPDPTVQNEIRSAIDESG